MDELKTPTQPDPVFWSRLALAVYWPLLLVATHWPRLQLELAGQPGLKVDKVVHFAAFALLAALIVHARLLGRGLKPMSNLLLACVLAAAYSQIDEWTQFLFARSSAWDDAAVNLLAVATTFVAQWLTDSPWRGPTLRVWACRLILCVLVPYLGVLAFTRGLRLESYPLEIAPALGLRIHADKVAHFATAAVLLWLMYGAAPLGLNRRWANAGLVLGLSILAGPAVEYIQRMVGRDFEYADMGAHELGVLAGIVVFLGARFAFRLTAAAAAGRRPVGTRWDEAAEPVQAEPVDETGAPVAASPGRPTPAASTSAGARGQGFIAAALTVSLLTFISRLTGLARDVYLSSAFGLSAVADAFWFGFQMPNLFRRLFGEGALTAAFIPVYAELVERDRQLSRRFASLCIALTLVVVGGLTVLGELVLLGLLTGKAWSADSSLAIRLTMIMLPYMPLVCAVALFGAVLQVHGRFAPSAGMPILLNVVMVIGTWFATAGISAQGPLRKAVLIVAVFVLIAGGIQFITQLWIMLKHESLTVVFRGAGPWFKVFWNTFIPSFLALSVFQVNTFVDAMIAMGLSPKNSGPAAAGHAAVLADKLHLFGYLVDYPIRQGGLAALNAAQRLYQFPLGVFGVSIATAIFPALSKASGEAGPSGERHFRDILRQGLRLTMFVGLPASIGLILTALPLARTLFERGAFTREDSYRVTWVLAAYAPAIWAYAMTQVLTRAFYAMKDARTPMVLSVLMVGLNLILNLTLVWVLGAAGLACATATCAILQCLLMLVIVRGYLDTPIDRGVWTSWGKTALLSAAMAAVLIPILILHPPGHLAKQAVLLELLVMLTLGAAVFLGGAWLLDCEEMRWLRKKRKALKP